MALLLSHLNVHREVVKRIETQAEADAMNAQDRALGIDWHWRVGDDYYELRPRTLR